MIIYYEGNYYSVIGETSTECKLLSLDGKSKKITIPKREHTIDPVTPVMVHVQNRKSTKQYAFDTIDATNKILEMCKKKDKLFVDNRPINPPDLKFQDLLYSHTVTIKK